MITGAQLTTMSKQTVGALLFVGVPLAALVLPPLVATHFTKAGAFSILLAGVAYASLWLLACLLVLDAAGMVYEVKRPFFEDARLSSLFWFHRPERNLHSFVASALTSYALLLYAFAVAYAATSAVQPVAFTQSLGFFDSLYYSLVTAATVGFGDVAPVSTLARALTMLEIVIAFLYAVFIFAAIVTHAVQNEPRR